MTLLRRSLAHTRLAAALILALSSGLAACHNSTDSPTPHPFLISSAQSSLTVAVGKKTSMTLTVVDQYGSVMTNPVLTYSSENNAIATVDGSGVITGVSVGTTRIRADGVYAYLLLQVNVTATPCRVVHSSDEKTAAERFARRPLSFARRRAGDSNPQGRLSPAVFKTAALPIRSSPPKADVRCQMSDVRLTTNSYPSPHWSAMRDPDA